MKAVWDGEELVGMAAIGHDVAYLVTQAQMLEREKRNTRVMCTGSCSPTPSWTNNQGHVSESEKVQGIYIVLSLPLLAEEVGRSVFV